VGKGKEDDLDEAYELFGVEEDATEKEIQSAYRKLSLKCHPDRCPDDPNASEKFDRLTRAKDLLLDPARREELDRKRKGKRDLEERFAQEDGKRKKMRMDLEGREAAAAAGRPRPGEGPTPQELRKRAAQLDYAERLKAKQVEVAGRQSEVVEQVSQAREAASEGRLRITWRAGGPPVSREVILKALDEFGVLQIEVSEEGAMAQLGSREDALRAVLECRQRKHQLSFRVALASAKKAESARDTAPPAAFKPDPLRQAKAKAAEPCSFLDFEAQMFADLQNLAKQKQAAKS